MAGSMNYLKEEKSQNITAKNAATIIQACLLFAAAAAEMAESTSLTRVVKNHNTPARNAAISIQAFLHFAAAVAEMAESTSRHGRNLPPVHPGVLNQTFE